MDKPLNVEAMMHQCSWYASLEEKVKTLDDQQEALKCSLEELVGQIVHIKSINIETKKVFWQKVNSMPTRKLVNIIRTALFQILGPEGQQWQCRVLEEE